jgi:hypothetical protein
VSIARLERIVPAPSTLGEFEAALQSFKEAYRNFEDASLLYNIVQCERQLGHKREAVRSYRAHLNTVGEAENRDAVRQIIAQLEREIADEDRRKKESAPPVLATPPPSPSPSPSAKSSTAVDLSARPPARQPAYKKWWVWTLVGVVAGGAAAGLAVGLTRSPTAPSATTTFGTHTF